VNSRVRTALQRSWALPAFPILVAVVLAALSSRSGWDWEWARAVSWASGNSVLLCPIAAGLAALEAWRVGRPASTNAMASSIRGPRALRMVVVVVWAYCALALLVGVLVAVLVAGRNDPSGPWGVSAAFRATTALLAATALGGVVGAYWRHPAAAPIVGLAIYFFPLLLGPFGLRDVFVAGGATGTLAGSEPNLTVLVAHVALHLSLTTAALIFLQHRVLPATGRRLVLRAGALSVAGILLGIYVATGPIANGQVPARSTETCVTSSRGTIDVCGPLGGQLYQVAADSLEEASDRVLELGVIPASRYGDGGNGIMLSPGRGILTITVEDIENDRLSVSDVVLALATPNACPALYGSEMPTRLLDAQEALAGWTLDVLNGATPATDDNTAAAETMAALSECAEGQLPQWRYGP